MVCLVISRVMASATPRRMSIEPSVMRNDGSRVFTTRMPLMAPRLRASANVRTTARAGSTPYWEMSSARNRLLTAIMEPTERSNSPAIMSSATGAPRMPICAAVWRNAAMPMPPRKPRLPASTANTRNTAMAPMSAPISGRANIRRNGLSPRSRLEAVVVAVMCSSNVGPAGHAGRP
jgi:hypothetical protein